MISTDASNIDTNNITFNPNITRLSNGSKHMGIGLKNKKLIIQTSFMNCPFGLSSNKYDNDKYTIDLSFDLENKEHKKFHKKLLKLDKLIINEILNRSSILFTNKLSNTVIENNYCSLIKKTKGYAPRFRIKLPYEDNKFNFEIIDTENNNIDDLNKYLNKGVSVRCTIECGGIWIVNDNYNCIWKMKRLEIKKENKPLLNDFIDDSDDE